MGIRFYCPNGHRLHVKSFLAGKRGICPHCATRFHIPPESEIPRGSPKIKPNSQAAAASTNGKRNGSHASVAAPTDLLAESIDLLAESPATPAAAKIQSGVDPIAEAPDAIWYVRPPSGGQYGPAKGDVMRRWIQEGRVSSDSLVWREGWADWSKAGPVFPTLAATYTAPAAAAAAPAPAKREAMSLQLQPAAAEPPGGTRPASVVARTASPPKSLATVIVLGLIVLVLVVVLVVVVATRN